MRRPTWSYMDVVVTPHTEGAEWLLTLPDVVAVDAGHVTMLARDVRVARFGPSS